MSRHPKCFCREIIGGDRCSFCLPRQPEAVLPSVAPVATDEMVDAAGRSLWDDYEPVLMAGVVHDALSAALAVAPERTESGEA